LSVRLRLPSCAALLGTGALALVLAGLPSQPRAQELEAGRQKAAAQCAVCHGPAGISTTPDAPHLAGQPAIYLAAQLRAYRNGQRRHEVMAVIARALTDDDIAAVVAWYAAIKVEATPPASR
jgi:cytochrome c553